MVILIHFILLVLCMEIAYVCLKGDLYIHTVLLAHVSVLFLPFYSILFVYVVYFWFAHNLLVEFLHFWRGAGYIKLNLLLSYIFQLWRGT